MPVPPFQEMFLPFLQFLNDGEAHPIKEVREHLVHVFQLTEDDIDERVPSGQQTKLSNRVGWGRTHLKKAGLIEQVERGVLRITNTGKAVVTNPPENLNLKFLDSIPAHRNWFHQNDSKTKSSSTANESEPSDGSQLEPEERMGIAQDELNLALASDLLDQLTDVNPYRFEQIVVDLLFAMGYGGSREQAAQVTQKSNDEGIDGIINEDRLGLDVIYIQAKRWQNVVGRKEIQSFVGALAGKQATKGVFITTSHFAKTAIDYAASVAQQVILIDGERLAKLMIEHNVGVSGYRSFRIKKLDTNYFEEN